jgi:hypothetical protein
MVQAWHLYSALMKEKDRLQVEEMETKANGSKPGKELEMERKRRKMGERKLE